MVLPLLGGNQDGADSMPFGVAVCLQCAGMQKPISSTVRDRTLSLTTSAHANITEKQCAAAHAATVELSRQLRDAAAAELVTMQASFLASHGSLTDNALPPDAIPQAFLKLAQKFTAVACSAQLALVYVVSSPPAGGDRLVCVNADGVIEGQPCGRGIFRVR